ncbi:hypothetical protein [Kitasatospora sp. McL0602]|uniref:hypothetical protein n=1 Tax=Kitasatospora sp. McL0602 TaxID=3439530 RepID=UPI003F88E536
MTHARRTAATALLAAGILAAGATTASAATASAERIGTADQLQAHLAKAVSLEAANSQVSHVRQPYGFVSPAGFASAAGTALVHPSSC